MNQNEIANALQLDDNDFPKQIWSFIFTGKQFSKRGPDNYSLAHLFDHKESERIKTELEFPNDYPFEPPYYGLYTCPSNTAYIPNSLLKPTDFNLALRRLLFQKAESLYKSCCNILPHGIKVPKPEMQKWEIDNFTWSECTGDIDNIDAFFTYREKIRDKFLSIQS